MLVRSIIEQATEKGLPESIDLVLRRYQLSDTNLSAMIEKLFGPIPIHPVDEQLSFVDSLKQEAADDKIQFDHEQIFDQVRRLNRTSPIEVFAFF